MSECHATAYREPDLAVTPTKWTNGLAALGKPWTQALLANAAPPSITAQISLPVNEAAAPGENG